MGERKVASGSAVLDGRARWRAGGEGWKGGTDLGPLGIARPPAAQAKLLAHGDARVEQAQAYPRATGAYAL
eukprot:9490904-Pyramimonas_sp.AAC.1